MEGGCLQGNLLHSHPSLKTFEPRNWQPHPYSVQITGLLLPQALAGPQGRLLGARFGEGRVRLAGEARGAAGGSCFTRELESCESVA